MTPQQNKNEILDVAVVGGGVSGVYSAWRLLRDSSPTTFPNGGARPRITVFEGSERIGGRLLSVTPPGMPNTTCELGGMRFMSRHVIVSALVEYFELPVGPFPVFEPNNIAFLRGSQLRLTDLNVPSEIPYRFSDVEKKVVEDPNNGLLLYALKQLIPNCLDISYEDLTLEVQKASFAGTPLREHGFWNLLARILTPDGYAFVRDSCGYDLIVSNCNAADAILFILSDFGPGVVYSRCVNGYDQLPKKIADEFEGAGGKIQFNSWLASVDSKKLSDGTNGVELHFRDGSIVHARHVILAMPRRSLELLEHTGSVFDWRNKDVWTMIESVYPIPMLKIFLAYRYPWWKAANVSQGRTLTDLPIRQCYYWDTVKEGNVESNAVLLASYDDENSVSYWTGLRKTSMDTEYYQPTKQFEGEPVTPNDWNGYLAPKAMVEEAHRQIVQMHGVGYAPEPYAATYRDWAEDPYGGGINVWQIGANSWEVVNTIVHPRADVPVYICGSAYSHEQGWVEGALNTAELMLKKCFNLKSHLHNTQSDTSTVKAPAGVMSSLKSPEKPAHR
ncbi:MAG: NAD(P)/FAD-dependent oxidoreductase [Gemmatimonadaceae bacterium]